MKQKLQLTQKPQMRLSLTMRIVAVSSGIGILLITGFLLFNLLGTPEPAKALNTSITSVATGNWNNGSTWDLGRKPQNGEEVIIQTGHNVMVTTNELINGSIKVYGILSFLNGKITMDSTSSVQIHALGQLVSGGPGNSDKINIGSYNWTGNNINLVNAPNNLTNQGPSGSNPLPIQLVSFDGSAESDAVLLNWQTATEVNNDYFTLERSSNGQDFRMIGSVKGAGNSRETIQYSYKDESASKGISYYRLKQTDFDGKYEYSSVISVDVKQEDLALINVVSAGPNPFNQFVNVEFDSESRGTAEMLLININGAIVNRESIATVSGRNSYILKDKSDLPNGIYFLSIQHGSETSKPVKLIKN